MCRERRKENKRSEYSRSALVVVRHYPLSPAVFVNSLTWTNLDLRVMSLPAPGGPRSSALALALGTPASSGVSLLGSDGLVLSGGRVVSVNDGNLSGLGRGHVDGRGDRIGGDHSGGLDPGACLDDRLLGADLTNL